ncbi:hypothetical protein DOTSEDRAFT_37590 [Dothistroma septosporum NZE10]|uniref:Lysine-specific metallo-endopeptidase domain-containing protein n=1 Tax=Dothistroma septosporum (strain NZE10 / CBS 128990) TaxID=675120 RepID=N1PE02_DOTSN|nr:hypothetical protein DOTSEDRAFT_37590 [Dothistroma septosporum NZE10]
MRLEALPAVILLLGTAIATPPGGKSPADPKGRGSTPGGVKGGASNIGGNLVFMPAAAGSSKSARARQTKLADIFDVLLDKSKDSCTPYYDPKAEPRKSDKLLNQYWDQVYTFVASGEDAVESLYKSNVEKRKLMQLYFGIEATEQGVSSRGTNGQALEKVQEWHRKMMSYATTTQKGAKKPILACGSSFMEFQESSDPMKDTDGEDMRPNLYRFMQDHGLQWYDYWVFWDQLDKSYHVAERDEQQKEHWGSDPAAMPFPEDDDKDIHICNHPEVYANTFGAGLPLRSGASDWEKRTHRNRGTIVLCPQSFEAMTDVTPPITKQKLDTGAHAVGTELASMGTNAITLYHELFHLVFESQLVPGKPRVAGDAQRVGTDISDDKDVSPELGGFALGPIQCGYVALFDIAEPRATKLEDLDSMRNPESYAWFGLTSALHDQDKMDWSSGVAQKTGGAFKGVFASKHDYRGDKYVPINAECSPRPSSDEGGLEAKIGRKVKRAPAPPPKGKTKDNLSSKPAGRGPSSKPTLPKQLKFSDVLDAVTGDKTDSCDQWLDVDAEPGKSEKLLNRRWDEAYEIALSGWNAVGEQYEQNAERRKLVQSYFGVKPAPGGNIPVKGFEGEAFDKLQEFQKPFSQSKDTQGKNTGASLFGVVQTHKFVYDDYWFWWYGATNEYFTSMRAPKDRGGGVIASPFPQQVEGDYWCETKEAQYGGISWPNHRVRLNDSEFTTRLRTFRPFVMLCPQFLTAPEEDSEPFGRRSPAGKRFGPDTPLSAISERVTILFHELVHMIIQMTDPMKGDEHPTPDAMAIGAKMDEEGKAVPGFPAEKQFWEEHRSLANGPICAMYVALHDTASPRVQNVDDLQALMYPENYAWFGITNALYTRDQLDWSSGISKKPGGEWKGVWTSNDRYTHDGYGFVPLKTCEESDDGGDGGDVQRGIDLGLPMIDGPDGPIFDIDTFLSQPRT